MRRRRWAVLTSIVAAGLLAAGCGGSGTDGSGAPASTDDAAALLDSVNLTPEMGTAARVRLALDAELEGDIKDPQLAAFLGDEPITAVLEGTTDAKATAMDMTFDVDAGKLALKGALRAVDGKGYIAINDRWYALPDDAFSGTDMPLPDQRKLLAALGDVSDLIADPQVVGAEDVNGITADHVRGQVNVAALMAAIGRMSGELGGSEVISPEQIAEATGKIEEYVDSAQIDLWIAQDTKTVVRMALDVDVALDGEAKEETGLDGVGVRLDVTSTPLDEAPQVSAPENPGSADELGQALLPMLFGAMAAAGQTP